MFDPTNRHDFVAAAVVFEGALIGVAAGLGWCLGVSPLARWTWQARGFAAGLAAALPMFVLFFVGWRLPLGPFRQIRRLLFETLGASLAVCRWYDLLLIALVAGLGEELLFRGVLHAKLGIVWSNVLFGLVHFVTPLYVLLAGLIGAYLGWLLDFSGSLAAPVLAHGLYDFLAFLVVAHEYRRRQPQPAAADEPPAR